MFIKLLTFVDANNTRPKVPIAIVSMEDEQHDTIVNEPTSQLASYLKKGVHLDDYKKDRSMWFKGSKELQLCSYLAKLLTYLAAYSSYFIAACIQAL